MSGNGSTWYRPCSGAWCQVPLGLDVPRWIDDPRVDLDYHIQAASLPAPVTAVALGSFVSGLAGHKLDRRYPLWQMHVIEGSRGTVCASWRSCTTP